MSAILCEYKNKEEEIIIDEENFHYNSMTDADQRYTIPIALISLIDYNLDKEELTVQYYPTSQAGENEEEVTIYTFSSPELEKMVHAFQCLLAGKGFQKETSVERETSSFIAPLLVFVAAGFTAYYTWGKNSLFLVIAITLIWIVYRLFKAKKRPVIHWILAPSDE